jgi:hypothetical protein
VTQLLRQGDSQVFKRYSQIKLQMKREALEKINRQANEMPVNSGTAIEVHPSVETIWNWHSGGPIRPVGKHPHREVAYNQYA